jgi:N-acyl homoserine lactone hydrolase
MSMRTVPYILAAAVFVAFGFPPANAQQKPQPPQSLRLYVLDCGIITPPNVDNYGFKPNEVADTRMVTPCFLIVHPRGSLIWDTGEIPDSAFKDGVSPQKLNNFTVDRPLLPQLAAIGYTPANITYLGLSHYHGDHVPNASLFAGSTWIVQKADRDPILAPRPEGSRVPDPKFFAGLANSKTVVLNGEDHDVFGDGTVVIKSTPGHTPGHQSLFLKLANTGNVLLSGDLYHYPEEITYKKVPSFDTDKEQTAKPRDDRGIREAEPRAAVDPARLPHRDQAEDRSRVLRLSESWWNGTDLNGLTAESFPAFAGNDRGGLVAEYWFHST